MKCTQSDASKEQPTASPARCRCKDTQGLFAGEWDGRRFQHMTKHANKFLIVVVVGLAVAWRSAELRVRSLRGEMNRLLLRELTVEARDAVTGDLLQTVVGRPDTEDGVSLFRFSSMDGKSMRILWASSRPPNFRVSSPGYAEDRLTTEQNLEATAVIRLKKL